MVNELEITEDQYIPRRQAWSADSFNRKSNSKENLDQDQKAAIESKLTELILKILAELNTSLESVDLDELRSQALVFHGMALLVSESDEVRIISTDQFKEGLESVIKDKLARQQA